MFKCLLSSGSAGFFLNKTPQQPECNIPWGLVGFMLMDFVCALGVGSVCHPGMTPIQRMENSLTCYLLLDMGRMLALESCTREGTKLASRWLAPQTHSHLQELNGFMAAALMDFPTDTEFLPHRKTELPLEAWFGSLRKQFPTSMMRTRDYCVAAAKQMFKSMKTITKNSGCTWHNQQAPDEVYFQPVSEESFVDCAARSMSSAVKLMACCSQ